MKLSDQTVRVVDRIYTRQALEAMPREARMAIYNTVVTNSTATTTNSLIWGSNTAPYYSDPLTFKYVDSLAAYKDPSLQKVLLEGSGLLRDAGLLRENDMAWLKRRVNETCWVPA